MLLTHLFLLLANLPGEIGSVAFYLTLGFLPLRFYRIRERILPRYLSNLTHPTDLRVEEDDISGFFGGFIQSLQLQSSKVSECFISSLDFP